jgi:hypothetical protein
MKSQKQQQYEKTPEVLEDHFGNQHLAAAYHSLLKMMTQHVGESLHAVA